MLSGGMRVETAAFLVSAGLPQQFPGGARPEIAFAGRSNVGKSSLINRLLGRGRLAHTSSTPGRTRTINFYEVNGRFLFVDLPGYGYAKVSRVVKEAWWALVEGYVTERPQLRGVVHIVDGRHPPTPQDQELRDFLQALGLPSPVVLTKADKVSRGQWAALRTAAASALGLPSPGAAILFSAESGEGAPEIWRAIEDTLTAPARPAGGVQERAREPRRGRARS
jgi:GTP-binding protein